MVCRESGEIGDEEQIKEELDGAGFMSLMEHKVFRVSTFERGLDQRQYVMFSSFALLGIPATRWLDGF
jgi:hypothetical protein